MRPPPPPVAAMAGPMGAAPPPVPRSIPQTPSASNRAPPKPPSFRQSRDFSRQAPTPPAAPRFSGMKLVVRHSVHHTTVVSSTMFLYSCVNSPREFFSVLEKSLKFAAAKSGQTPSRHVFHAITRFVEMNADRSSRASLLRVGTKRLQFLCPRFLFCQILASISILIRELPEE